MSTDHNDRKVPRPPSAWQKKVLYNSLPLAKKARTALQKHVIRVTEAWRKKAGWKPKPKPVPKPDMEAVWRKTIVDWCLWSCDHNSSISYSQSRPKEDIRGKYRPTYLPTDLDCSSHAIRAYQVAGAPSPSVYGYSGYGSTYDMEGKGQWVGRSDPLPADLVFYHGHVAVYIGGGRVVSHGGDSGPVVRSVNYRSDRTSDRRYF